MTHTRPVDFSGRVDSILYPNARSNGQLLTDSSKAMAAIQSQGLNLHQHQIPNSNKKRQIIQPIQSKKQPDKNENNWTFFKQALAVMAIALSAGIVLKHAFTPGICDPLVDIQCPIPGVPTVSVELGGGTGNQMFLVAAAYAHALDIGGRAIYPTAKIDHLRNMSPIFSKIKRYNGTKPPPQSEMFYESNMEYVQLPKDKRSIHLKGAYFSAKYFDHHRAEILELYAPSPELKQSLETKYKELLSKETVAIHIRRGDYLTVADANGLLMCDLAGTTDYYNKALSQFDKDKHHFVIFSNDIEYAKKMTEFKEIDPDHITFIQGQKEYEDLYLMSMCKHQVMSNSTFSWWAAYLRNHPNAKVTYPMNAFWGGAATNPGIHRNGWWGPQIKPSDVHPNGVCSKGPDYFPMDHWIKIT